MTKHADLIKRLSVPPLPDNWLAEVMEQSRIRLRAYHLADQIRTDADVDAARAALDAIADEGRDNG